MRTKLAAAGLALVLAAGTGVPSAAVAAPASAKAAVGYIAAEFHNNTTRTLTLKAAHLDAGCWMIQPTPQRVRPGQTADWVATGGSCGGVSRGYVTYTVDGTGGQGYAYMWWFSPNNPGAGGQAGGLFALDVFNQGEHVTWKLRCLTPQCF